MDSVATSLGMNELAAEIADSMEEHAALLRDPEPYTRLRRPRDRCRGRCPRRIRRRTRDRRDLHGRPRNIAYAPLTIGGIGRGPASQVWTDHPAESCMASQYAGWAISVGKYFAMGSGPLRAHARVEKELFEKLGYEEEAERGVLVLEGRTLPTDAVAEWVAKKARLSPSQLTFVIAPTASLAGGVQIVGENSRDRSSQDGDTRLRRAPGHQRVRHGAAAARRQERSQGDRTNQRLHTLRRSGAIYRAGRRRRAGRAGGEGAGVGIPRLRHTVLRHLPAIRRRLLQDRPAALQSGGGLAHERGNGPDVPRGKTRSQCVEFILICELIFKFLLRPGSFRCDGLRSGGWCPPLL